MKSLIASIMILGLVGFVVGVMVQAADESGVTATVTVQNISVSVSDGDVDYGTIAAGASKDTVTLSDSQTANNNGNVTETFNIRGQNTACVWTLAGASGDDQYVHEFSDDAFTTATALTTSNQTLASGVAAAGSQVFDLKITTPNPSSCFDQQSVNVTVQATL